MDSSHIIKQLEAEGWKRVQGKGNNINQINQHPTAIIGIMRGYFVQVN